MEFGEVLSFYKTWDGDAVILATDPDDGARVEIKITKKQLETIYTAEPTDLISDPPQTATPSRR